MQPPAYSQKWPYILLSVGNLLGLIAALGLAGLLFLSSLFDLLQPAADQSGAPSASFLMACGMILCAGLFVPASIFSLQRSTGKLVRLVQVRQPKGWEMIVIALAWVSAVAMSNILSTQFKLGWLLAVPFYLAAVGLPVAALVWICVGGLPPGSHNRFWSSLGISMTATPLLALLLEILLGVVLLIGAILALILRPDWLTTLEHLSMRLLNTSDAQQINGFLVPYLVNPFSIFFLLLVMSVFIPIIEEATKPLVVWVIGGRLHTPAEGFAVGALCGAGFALVEGLVSASSPGAGWGALLAARAGASLMHITASALMGWAIVSARKGKRLRLLWVYAVSVGLHGLWNSGAVFLALGGLQSSVHNAALFSQLKTLSLVALVIIIVAVVGNLTILAVANRRLQPVPMPQSDIIPPPAA